MRNNETGEFELVVGNGQLLSGFFIVILLCAVMFAMGFVVARAKYQQEASNSSAPTSAGSMRALPISPPPQTPASADAPVEPAAPPPVVTTPPADTATPPQEPANSAQTQEAPAAPEGSYWQVIATKNQDSARTMLQTLRDKGFPAYLSPGPNNLTRVLVGPYSDTGNMGRAKTELESAGFNLVKH
jgi:cell division septation protein DedD